MGAPSRGQLVRVWIVAVGVMTALVVISVATRTGGDDPDQGRQRPGILDLGALPLPAPEIPGLDFGGEEAVVFFAGRKAADLCAALAEPPQELAEAKLVVVAEEPLECGPTAAPVRMSPVTAAEAYGLATPRDGAAPLGYAIVDASGRIRYRTLDPEVASMLGEVATMLRAVR